MKTNLAPPTVVEKLPTSVKSLFYLYLALLPFLAFWAMFLDKSAWLEFVSVGDPVNVGKFAFIVYSFVAIFLSGIFALIIVQNTPLPKKLIPALIMLLDVPFQIAIATILGNDLNISEIIIIDFVIETAGLVIAMIYLLISMKNKKTEENMVHIVLIVVFGIVILLSNYGVFAFNKITSVSLLDQIPFYTGIITTVLMYVRVLKGRIDMSLNSLKDEQVGMSNFASILLIGLWLSMIVIIFI